MTANPNRRRRTPAPIDAPPTVEPVATVDDKTIAGTLPTMPAKIANQDSAHRCAWFADTFPVPAPVEAAFTTFRASSAAWTSARVSLGVVIGSLWSAFCEHAKYFEGASLSVRGCIDAILARRLGQALRPADRTWVLRAIELTDACKERGLAFDIPTIPAGILADLLGSFKRYPADPIGKAKFTAAIGAAMSARADGTTRDQWRLDHYQASKSGRGNSAKKKAESEQDSEVSPETAAPLSDADAKADTYERVARIAQILMAAIPHNLTDPTTGVVEHYGLACVADCIRQVRERAIAYQAQLQRDTMPASILTVGQPQPVAAFPAL